MTPTRIFILVVVIVVVLYGISLALIGRQSGESADLSSPWLSGIKSRFLDDRPVRVE